MKLKILMGLLVFSAGAIAQVGYSGPSILSRGGSGGPGRRGSETLRFKGYAQVNGVYDSGLAPIATDEAGELLKPGPLYGIEGVIGAYGYHSWRRKTLGLDYRGNFRHFSKNTYFDGSDHSLSLDYGAQLSRRLTLTLRPTAGTSSRAFGGMGFGGYTGVNPDAFGVPLSELFDNRVYYFQQTGLLTYQKSARLSFTAGGQAFTVKRQSKALIGTNGYTALGDVAYRLNRNQTVFASYAYIHFGFPGVFGSTDANEIMVGHAIRLGRNWEFSAAGGGIRVESKGLRQVNVDPAIAKLVGQSTTIEAFHSIIYVPAIRASLGRSFRKTRITASYSQGLNPGNGVFLTSRTQTTGIGAGYTGIRRWNFAANVSYVRFSGMSFNQGTFGSLGGGFTTNYRINSYLHFNTRLDSRKAQISTSNYRRNSVRLSVGFTFSPGEVPVSIW